MTTLRKGATKTCARAVEWPGMADLSETDASPDIEFCPECGFVLELYLDEQLVGSNVIVRVDGANRYEIAEYEDNPSFEDIFDPDSAWKVICSDCSEEICAN